MRYKDILAGCLCAQKRRPAEPFVRTGLQNDGSSHFKSSSKLDNNNNCCSDNSSNGNSGRSEIVHFIMSGRSAAAEASLSGESITSPPLSPSLSLFWAGLESLRSTSTSATPCCHRTLSPPVLAKAWHSGTPIMHVLVN